MKKYSFFVDFDDTLVPTKHLVAKYLSNRYGVSLTSTDLTDNNGFDKTLKAFGVVVDGTEVYRDFGKNFFPSFKIEDFILFPDAKDVVYQLSEIYNMYIVTSRQEEERCYIKNILKHNGIFDNFENLHCVWKFQNGCYVGEPKVSFIKRQPGVHIGYLDDSIEEIKMAIRKSVYPILFDPFCVHKKEGLGYDICPSWKNLGNIYCKK